MNRLVLFLVAGVALFGLGFAAARGTSAEAGVCAQLTPEKLLEHPGIAHEYAQALSSGDDEDVGRVEHMLRDIRSAHGCRSDFAMPAAPAGEREPRLPPGHPPIHRPSLEDRGTRTVPLFGSTPGTVTI